MKKELKYAGFLQRSYASYSDIFYLLPIIVLSAVLYRYEDKLISTIAFIVTVLSFLLYEGLFLSGAKQATQGMRKEKIKVVDLNGNRISIARAIYRYMIYWAIIK